MTKLKVTCTRVIEFDVDLSHYPEGWTLEQIMQAEKESCETEPEFYMERGDMAVYVEVVNE